MIQRERLTLTAAGGSASATTRDYRGEVGLIFCKAATATTTFDLTLTDDASDVIFSREGIVGELNEIGGWLIKGVHTVTLANCSADEAFTFKLHVEESA